MQELTEYLGCDEELRLCYPKLSKSEDFMNCFIFADLNIEPNAVVEEGIKLESLLLEQKECLVR